MKSEYAIMLVCIFTPILSAQPPTPNPARISPSQKEKDIAAHIAIAIATVPYAIDLAWQVPFGNRLSWATASAPNPEATRSPARVFLVRGSGTIFTPGFGDLCTKLRRNGMWAEDLGPSGDNWIYQHLLAERKAGRLKGAIVLVGHSRGGRHIIETAQELQKAGIGVDLLICVDVAALPTVPSNVRQAINIYSSEHRVYPADILKPAPKSTTLIENIDLNSPRSPIKGNGLNHVTITANAAVQQFMVQRILQVASEAQNR
jgi:hypothetical protein